MKCVATSADCPAPSPAYAVWLWFIAMVAAAAILFGPAPATPTSALPLAVVSASAHGSAATDECGVSGGSLGHCQVQLAALEAGGLDGAALPRLLNERWNVRGEARRAQHSSGGHFRPPNSAALA